MTSQAGQWTPTPSATPLQPKKWNARFWITFNFWWSAGLVNGLKPHPPPISSQKNECSFLDYVQLLMIGWAGQLTQTPSSTSLQPKKWMLIFRLRSTSDDQLGWSMDSNRILNLSPAKKMKCSFLDYFQLLMISLAARWTQTQSTTPPQPKKWNAPLWITFNFWWSAGLVNGLKPHQQLLSSQKNEKLIFGLHSTSDVGLAGWWTRTPSDPPLQPKKWNAHFWITFNFWWLARLVYGLKPHLPPFSSPRKWNAHFWITFNFWWSPRLVDGLKPHQLPLFSPKNEMLIFGLRSTSDVGWAGRWTQTPSAIPLHPKKWNAHLWITFNFWWSAGLVDGLKPHPPPLSSQKKWNAHFWITFNFWWSAWLVDGLKPHLPPLPSQKIKCLFLDYVQLLMIGQAGRWTWTPSATPPQPKNEMLLFGLCLTSDDQLGWSMDPNPISNPSPAKKMKSSFLDYVQLLMISWLVDGLEPHLPPLSSQKKWNAHF